MPTRSLYDAVASSVLTAANLDTLAKGWPGYVTVTSDVTGVTTEQDLTGYTVSPTLLASRVYLVFGWIPRVSSATASDQGRLFLHKDGAQVNEGFVHVGTRTDGGGGGSFGVVFHLDVAPAAGASTYKLRGKLEAGTGGLSFKAAASSPGFLVCIDIGASS
jgi:hypothetical protein